MVEQLRTFVKSVKCKLDASKQLFFFVNLRSRFLFPLREVFQLVAKVLIINAVMMNNLDDGKSTKVEREHK